MKKILIADDSATDRHYLGTFLSQQGFQVLTAENGEEALQKARELRPDLILMDIVMPGLNGFQTTRAINRDEAVGHIPVIVCSSKDQETDRVWATRQGARDYVVKPVNTTDLLGKINRLI